MLAAVSHDLRTPLTRMRLQLDTHRDDSGASTAMRDKLRKDIELMHAMLSSALTFLRTGAEQENKEWLDLGALVATLCDEYEEGGARIRYAGPDQLRCHCRPDAMQRVFMNLIDNALRYGQSVLVTAALHQGALQIDVIDDGPGIPEDRLTDVLEPFVRLDSARGGAAGNVGLGLAIVHDILRSHGGEVVLTNCQPHGLRARVMLPA
jgi:signal transduction histidine kinase